MNRTLSHIPKYYQRYFLVFAAIILVLLTSCPVKSSIKTLVGLPVNTEQGLPKGTVGYYGNSSEKCLTSETAEIRISNDISSDISHLSPVILFTVTFLFLLAYLLGREKSHPRYGNLKISGSLPIFLQYRKLIL